MKKVLIVVELLFAVLCAAYGQAPGYDFTRSRLFSGFDGKKCKMSPGIATDWEGTILLSYKNLLLTGSDVFYDQFMYKSVDNGLTWKKQKSSKALKDIRDGDMRIGFSVCPHYSRFHSRWYAIGIETRYVDDKVPYLKVKDGKPYRHPYFADIDIEKGRIMELKEMPFPFEYGGVNAFGEPVELEDGDIIMTFYYTTLEQKDMNHKAVCVRYRFVEDGLEVVEAGTPIEAPQLRRGVCEPSLIRFQGKYYLTLRSDEQGMYCESADGLHFSQPKVWCWEDGTPIGNANTQQHWIDLGDRLYLTYTRKDAANKHVFRNRAPLYSAQFDPERGVLIKETEFPLVPELGARLGNFNTVCDGSGRAFLVTAEWMQPVGCEKYGSDNSIWFISINK